MMRLFNAYQKSVQLEGQIVVESALHIGSGKSTEILSTDSPVIRDFRGDPYIPGSSLKGCLRSFLESILPHQSASPLYACDVGAHPCVTSDQKKRIWNEAKSKFPGQYPEQEKEWIQYLDGHLCSLCKLFGSFWMASRVRIPDLLVDKAAWDPTMFIVRDCVRIDRESRTAASQGKFDFEVVPAGVRFRFKMAVDNPETWELGLLFIGLDALGEGFLSLGGGISKGAGRVRLEIEKVTEMTPDTLLAQEGPTSLNLSGEKASSIGALRAKLQVAPDGKALEANNV